MARRSEEESGEGAEQGSVCEPSTDEPGDGGGFSKVEKGREWESFEAVRLSGGLSGGEDKSWLDSVTGYELLMSTSSSSP